MRILRANIAISLLLLTVAGCGGGSEPSEASPLVLGQDAEMRVGQTRRLAGTPEYLTLVKVTEDSRCPINVQCVTAGNFLTEVRLFRKTGQGSDHTYRVSSIKATETEQDFPTLYKIEMRAIFPQKEAGIPPISQSGYRLTFRVTQE